MAAVLRLLGITWGLPGPTHLFSYHPDEYFSLQAALHLLSGDPNPHFFNYPSLYLYLAAVACMIGHGGFAMGATASQLPDVLRAFTLDARIMTVLLALGAVAAVYAAACRLGGRRAGLWSAAIVAVAPGHVLYSHFAAVDIALTFFMALAIWAGLALLTDRRIKTVILTGLAVGAAFATKYNGIVVVVVPWIALAMWAWRSGGGRAWRAAAARAAVVLLVAVVAFSVLSPFVLLDWGAAGKHIAYERDHMRQGEYPAKAAYPNGWWFHVRALGYAVGGSVPLCLLIALFACGICGRWPKSAPVLALSVLWFAIIGATGVRYARYGLPLVPLLAVGAGVGVGALRGLTAPWWRRVAAWPPALAIVSAAYFSCILVGLTVASAEPRDLALSCITARVPKDERIGLVRTMWFDMPPLDYNNGGDALGGSPLWRQFRRPVRELVVIADFDTEALVRERPEWFVETDFQVAEWLQAGDPRATEFHAALAREYSLYGDFGAALSRGGKTYRENLGWRLIGSCGPAPHDYSYMFTRIRVWHLLRPKESSRAPAN